MDSLKEQLTLQNSEVKSSAERKLGIFAAIAIILGGDMGIGIYFKNISVFNANNFNGYGVLCSWIIIAIVVICNAMCFGEIATCKVKGNQNTGLGGWSEQFLGRRAGRFISFTTPVLYLSFFAIGNGIFAAESIANCFVNADGVTGANSLHIGYLLMIALAIVALLVVCNTISYKFGSNTAKVTTFTKFLPLIMIIFIGIIFSCLGKGDNFFKSQIVPANDNSENTFSFTGMLSACPAIMFSFDGFLVVGAITNRLKNPKKDIPLSILIAMGISAVVYILITVAQLLLGASSAFNVFEKIGITNQDTITALSIILSVFMFVSSIGVLNSLSMASVHACEAAVENNTLYGSQWVMKKAKGKELVPGIIVFAILIGWYFLIMFLPSIIMNTDQIIDGMTSTVDEFYFVIYGIMGLACAINHKTNKVETVRNKYIWPLAIISGVGCIGVGLYSSLYQFGISPIVLAAEGINANDPKAKCSWGLLHNNAVSLNAYTATIFFWLSAINFCALPFLNDLAIKLTNKNYDQKFIWQK